MQLEVVYCTRDYELSLGIEADSLLVLGCWTGQEIERTLM